jgi:mono/diheme cytochrome c family protein
MNKIKSIVIAGLTITVGLVSCDSGEMRRTPGHIYAPDMTYSRAYDAYTTNPNFEDGLTSRKPVAGTIAQNHELPDHLAEGDTNAYKTFNTALRFNDAELAEGKRLFNIYCGICHGTALDGQGPLYTSGKFASMPANLKDAKYLHMPSGQVYAAIKYGKNMMGSYASQLDIKQRWMVVAYIKKVQSENGGDAYTYAASATTATAAAAPATDSAAAPAAH